ncbi:hypothetical protein Tco_0878574 [Tanacetum coccineum]|uniref:Reverse transcriptase domain-containing protein n=1 Tax=Tanacetum coccineum TaxID=301880 RepID=A0ABQ5BZW8_9ASTR
MISPAFIEANYKVLESILRERRKQMHNGDLYTKLEYYSKEYDKEREMDPRPAHVRETTPVLRTGSSCARRQRGMVVEFKDAPNRDPSRVKRESEGRRPSKRGAEDSGNHGVNLPLLLLAYIGRNENGQPLQLTQEGISLLTDYPLPDGLKMPSHVGSYDGKRDPDNYLYLFKGAIQIPRTITIEGNPFNIEHKLNENKHIEPANQKKRGLALVRNEAACKVVEELLKEDILREVKYQTWVANPVMVKKTDRRWKMLKNAGATYQRMINKVFSNQIGQSLEAYVDDIVIKSAFEEYMLIDIQETFNKLWAINMKINPKKCSFGIEEEGEDIEIKKSKTTNEESKPKDMWNLYTNRATSYDGSSTDLRLVSPKGKEHTYALRFSLVRLVGGFGFLGGSRLHFGCASLCIGDSLTGTFAYPYLTGPFDENLWNRLRHHTFEAQTFSKPILYLMCLTSSWEHASNAPSIFIDEQDDNDQCESSFILKDQDAPGLELAVVDATVIKLVAVGSSSKAKLKKRKQECSTWTSTRGSVPPPPVSAPKGVGKHPWMLARFMGNSKGDADSFAPDAQEAYYPYNMLFVPHSHLIKNKLESVFFDDLVNVYDVHALQMVVVKNMLANESRVVLRDYSKLKGDFVSFRNKKGLLEYEMYKLEDSLSKARKNQDLDGSQVLKDLRYENARIFEELSMLREVVTSTKDSRKKLAEQLDSLSKEPEEIAALSLKLKITDLERVELVKDLFPLVVKKLISFEHFNKGDLKQKSTTYGRSQALNEVHGLGDSWDFKDVEDYHPEAKKIYDEVVEAFYKLEFLYISLLVEKVGQSLGELAAVDPPTIQEAPNNEVEYEALLASHLNNSGHESQGLIYLRRLTTSSQLGRYGVSVPSLTKDHEGNKIQYAISRRSDRHPTYHETPTDQARGKKSSKHGKVFNWETAKYGKIWYDEDVLDLRSVKTKFPAIVFNDSLTSNETPSCEPTVSSLNDEIDFIISLDDSDDEDYTPTVSCIDDLDFFKDFKNEFPAIVYSDALTSKSDFSTEPTLCP